MAQSRSRAATVGSVRERRRHAGGVDLEVRRRIRQRRIDMGITQQRLAELIGVSYQQASSYETGASRLSAGRLYRIAEALGVGVGHFFEGAGPGGAARRGPAGTTRRRRTMLALARDFLRIGSRKEREALCALARALAALPGPE
jgi:transcriptional regulator with XRE-family HTH domain